MALTGIDWAQPRWLIGSSSGDGIVARTDDARTARKFMLANGSEDRYLAELFENPAPLGVVNPVAHHAVPNDHLTREWKAAVAARTGIVWEPTRIIAAWDTPWRGARNGSALWQTALAVACGLRHLHSLGIVHNDVKPSNTVFADAAEMLAVHGVADDGGPIAVHARAALIDLGLAFDQSDAVRTARMMPLGTRGFIHPSFAHPWTAQSEAASPPVMMKDAWALAVTLLLLGAGGRMGDYVPAGTALSDRDLGLQIHAAVVRGARVGPAGAFVDVAMNNMQLDDFLTVRKLMRAAMSKSGDGLDVILNSRRARDADVPAGARIVHVGSLPSSTRAIAAPSPTPMPSPELRPRAPHMTAAILGAIDDAGDVARTPAVLQILHALTPSSPPLA